ncbi:MAG TPA: PQQ-dependent sugar dehydrogenase, partial [Planctomycetota bacterium]|nr:PQQ-dependent sugar dehydrogenase [Planctomycetota bacterium]
VGVEGARPELWAFGLRNPWRMTIDERTGAIWIGNNGQDLWETVHLLERGANFGWSIYEGSHPFYLQRALGPTPPVAPTIEHHHREARSLTGGVVYYGDALSELDGAYVYGDYSTGKIWGARHDGSRVTWHRELADTSLQIAAFAMGHRGDLYIVDHGSGIYRLVPRDGGDEGRDTQEGDGAFPTRLSETGILASVVERTPALGVVPYDVIVPAWHDGAVAERLIAVPKDGKISYTGSRGWAFPDGSVLVQTLSIVAETPDEENAKRERLRPIETRILLRQEGEWAGYAYLWNDARTDAELVDAKGAEIDIEPLGEGGRGRRRAWRVPSRAECLSCHSRAAGFVLGLSAPQMSRERDYGGVRANQILALRAMGLLDGAPRTKEALERIPRLVDPYDSSFDLEDRARSYLHASCSSCHVEAGGGNATMELEITRERERMNLIGARPQHAVFGLENAMIVAPGDPDRSVLVERLRRRGSGQMPPFGSTIADERAVALFREWIESLREVRPIVRRWTLEALVPGLDRLKEERSFESGREAFRVARCGDCHRLGDATGTIGPDLSRLSKDRSAREILEAIVEPSRSIAPEYAFTVIVTNDGRVITGRIEREDAGAVVLRPAASGEAPIAIERSAIAARSPSDVSSMPEGTIDTLTEDEILDLLAYLIAGGDREHPSFHRARR